MTQGTERDDAESEESWDFDLHEMFLDWEGQPPPDPNPGWLKRLWYRLTGVI